MFLLLWRQWRHFYVLCFCRIWVWNATKKENLWAQRHLQRFLWPTSVDRQSLTLPQTWAWTSSRRSEALDQDKEGSVSSVTLDWHCVSLCFSLRTGAKTVRGRAPSPSTTQGRSDSVAWVSLFYFMRTTWTSHPPGAPSPSGASLA